MAFAYDKLDLDKKSMMWLTWDNKENHYFGEPFISLRNIQDHPSCLRENWEFNLLMRC